MQARKTVLSSIPLPLAERLDAIVEQLEMSYDEAIAEAISTWVDREEERRLFALSTLVSTNSMLV